MIRYNVFRLYICSLQPVHVVLRERRKFRFLSPSMDSKQKETNQRYMRSVSEFFRPNKLRVQFACLCKRDLNIHKILLSVSSKSSLDSSASASIHDISTVKASKSGISQIQMKKLKVVASALEKIFCSTTAIHCRILITRIPATFQSV